MWKYHFYVDRPFNGYMNVQEIGTSMEEEDDDMGDIVDREDEEEEELEEMEEQMATKTIKVIVFNRLWRKKKIL